MDAHVALGESPPSPVEELVDARFAFADPRGRVTRWGEGAEELFGIPAEQIVGQPLFDVALVGADGGWEAFLTGDGAHCPPSRLEVSVNRADGQVFTCVVYLVPVLLADGLDFSQFAADLGLDHGDSLDAFKERHQRVLGLIESAARDGAHYAEGERLAGLIATFRPDGGAPASTGERIDEALIRAERAEREVEDLRDPLSRFASEFAELRACLEGVGERIEHLERRTAEAGDTAAAVAALESSVGERLEALESRQPVEVDTQALATEVERTIAERLELALVHRLDEALPARIDEALNAQLDHALPGRVDQALGARMDETLSDRVEQTLHAHLESALTDRIEQAMAAQAGQPPPADLEAAVARRVDDAVSGRIEDALNARVEQALPADLEARMARRIEEALPGRIEEALNGRIEEALPGRIEEALPGRIEEALNGRIEQAVTARIEEALNRRVPQAPPADLEETVARRIEEALPARIEEALARRPEPAPLAAPDGPLSAEVVDEVVAKRVREAVADRIEDALAEARQAREEAEQVARELRAGRSSSKPKPLPVGFYSSDGPPEAPDRPSLPDFDEVTTPLATLSLDGRFMHLNGAFRDLVGYSEEEFASARWPSPAFTEHMGSQRELKRALAAGELEETPVETAYMHREGLLVPLIGRMAVVRDEDGVPDHLLFRVGAA